MVRETQDPFVFHPFNSLHHSSPTFFSCVWRRWHLWQHCSQVCFCVLSPVTCYVVYQAGRKCWESVAIQSAFFLMPHVFTIRLQSCISILYHAQAYSTVDIPYSCHTTLIPPWQGISVAAPSFLHLSIRQRKKLFCDSFPWYCQLTTSHLIFCST